MRTLAIETVETTGSVAALENECVLAERRLDSAQRSAQSLAPGIEALLRDVAWRPTDVQLVSVASGPGSFTGLRIGVTTAKTFAYSIGCSVIGVHTLVAIASQAPADISQLWAVLDARRGELFVAQFVRRVSGELASPTLSKGDGQGERVVPEFPHPNPLPNGEGITSGTRIVLRQQWLEELAPGDVVTGPGLASIFDQLPREVVALDRAVWAPTAATIGLVGWRMFVAGQRADVFGLVPEYFRRTAAEDEWDRKRAR
jgi:tRNA threonylcarbamoyladenosine biosynthesis protein TsaB